MLANTNTLNFPQLGTLYCKDNCYNSADWIRVVGYTKKQVRFEPVPVISTYIIDGGSSVVDMDWLEKNPVTSIRNSTRFQSRKISYDKDGRGYLPGKRWETLCFVEATNPETPRYHVTY
jgi:hypothetical protein